MTYLDELKEAIRATYGCEAEHDETVSVREVFRGRTLCEGAVEIFDLHGHESARRCFAWTHTEEGEKRPRYVTMLELPPIDSPQAAVRAALLQEVQAERRERASAN